MLINDFERWEAQHLRDNRRFKKFRPHERFAVFQVFKDLTDSKIAGTITVRGKPVPLPLPQDDVETIVGTMTFREFLRQIVPLLEPYYDAEESRQAMALAPSRAVSVPQFAENLLYWFLPQRERESIPGDLREQFSNDIAQRFSPLGARLWYWKEVLTSIGPIIQARLLSLLKLAALVKLASWILGRG